MSTASDTVHVHKPNSASVLHGVRILGTRPFLNLSNSVRHQRIWERRYSSHHITPQLQLRKQQRERGLFGREHDSKLRRIRLKLLKWGNLQCAISYPGVTNIRQGQFFLKSSTNVQLGRTILPVHYIFYLPPTFRHYGQCSKHRQVVVGIKYTGRRSLVIHM